MLLLLIFNTMIHSWAWILWLQHVWWVAMGTAKPWCHHRESDRVLLRCHLRDSDLTQVVWRPTKIAYTCNETKAILWTHLKNKQKIKQIKNDIFFSVLSVSLPFKKLYNSFRSRSETNNNATNVAVSSSLVSAIQWRNAIAHNRISVNQCTTLWYCMLHDTCCLLFWGLQPTGFKWHAMPYVR